jgi:hypothetical protein
MIEALNNIADKWFALSSVKYNFPSATDIITFSS